jgi:hypothetical protein
MESWNHIIHTALLGTDKQALKKENLVAEVVEQYDLIAQNTQSREEVFLQTAALVYNYRQCGFLPVQKETVFISRAKDEEKEYANGLAYQTLYDIIETGSSSLLQFWLEECAKANKIVQYELIPELMDAGVKQKSLQPLVHVCCGHRGAWLTQFNAEWKYAASTDEEERWQTGTLEQRKKVLAQVRKANPDKGRDLLQQAWAQENAAAKTELIQELRIHASEEDLPWLEELLNEKSAKVKAEVLEVIKRIPSSSVVQNYWRLLQQSILLSTSKGLLGIGSKQSLEIQLAPVEETIFKTGIQPVSSQAGVSDDHFILEQLIGQVPPHFWEAHFNLDSKKIIELFLKNNKYKSLVSSFGLAASRFKNPEWMRTIITADENSLYLDALDELPQKEAEAYALKFLADDERAVTVLPVLQNFSEEWSLELSKAVLKFTSKTPYQYHRGFYNQIAHLLSLPVVGELEKFTPKEEYLRTMWSNLSEYIIKLLSLKLQTLKAFKE